MSKNRYLMGLGQNIVQLRREAMLTQEQLAERAGIGAPHMSDIERAMKTPSILTVHAIATALGVPTARLLPEPIDPGIEMAALLAGRTPSEKAQAVALVRVLFPSKTT